jgi:hypothetical protein
LVQDKKRNNCDRPAACGGVDNEMTEVEIRAALRERLAASPQGAGAAFIAEMFVDGFSRRADLVMANGKLAAFEIKSDRDSLDRLDGQLRSYLRFFEQVSVVCAERHLPGVLATAPAEVGVLRVASNGDIRLVRPPLTVQGHTAREWVSFLPVDEVRNLLRSQRLLVSGSRDMLLQRCDTIEVSTIRAFVLEYLKRRDERIAAITARRPAARRCAGPSTKAESPADHLNAFLSTMSSSMTATPRLVRHSSKPSSSSSES